MATYAQLIDDDNGRYSFPLGTRRQFLASVIRQSEEDYGPGGVEVHDRELLGWGPWEMTVKIAGDLYMVSRDDQTKPWPEVIEKALGQ